MKNWLFVGCALLCAVVNATPYVTNVVAKQRYPWNGLVDVSYEIVGSTNGIDCAYGYLIAIDQKTQKYYPASTFTKPIDLTEGTHTAIWNMAADYAVTSEVMTFRLSIQSLSIQTLSLYRVIDVSEGATAIRYPVLELDEVPSGGWGDGHKTNKIVLRRIDGTNGVYYAGIFEITQAQWDKVMGGTSTSTYPKNAVSFKWIRGKGSFISEVVATSFIGKLRQKTGLTTLDLPSGAEWEFAGRAGVTTKWLCGDSEAGLSDYAWYSSDSGSSTHPVGELKPNVWGLYDVHGNVSEWSLEKKGYCNFVLCGGSFDHSVSSCALDCKDFSNAYDLDGEAWSIQEGCGFRLFCRPEQ